MRWDHFFDDLETQLASEWEAERAALDTEAERLRLSRVTLRERLEAAGAATGTIEFADGTVVTARVQSVGADWAAFHPDPGAPGALIAPLTAIVSIGMPHADVLRSARPAASARSALRDRLTFGYVVRDLVRRRAGVRLQLIAGRQLTGTIDRAGVDHLDLALHDAGSPRRAAAVSGHRLVPFTAISWVGAEEGVGV